MDGGNCLGKVVAVHIYFRQLLQQRAIRKWLSQSRRAFRRPGGRRSALAIPTDGTVRR